MLPRTVGRARDFSGSFFPVYLRRVLKPNQMDFEYRHTSYHKQTKNQWARDDPAFVVLCCGFLAVAGAAYCITFGRGFWNSVLTVTSVILLDFLGIGVVFSSLCWFIANQLLKRKALHHHTSDQSVEWMYAFDVHCNSFVPMFMLLYVLQFFLSPLLLWKSLLSAILANVLYSVAFCYYHYMNFLGYSALPFLEHTEVYLWPVALLFVYLPFALLSGFNPARFVLNMYFG